MLLLFVEVDNNIMNKKRIRPSVNPQGYLSLELCVIKYHRNLEEIL